MPLNVLPSDSQRPSNQRYIRANAATNPGTEYPRKTTTDDEVSKIVRSETHPTNKPERSAQIEMLHGLAERRRADVLD